jgi:uncharacterized membrane-anchored protein YitT (DUF2179 family)
VYKNIETALYTVVVIFVSARVIDYVIYGTGNGKLLLVVTRSAAQIAAGITAQMRRGVTVLPVRGGYTGEEKEMLLCAVRSHEVSKLNRLVKQYDEGAFTIITEAGEILGEGFRRRN